MRDVGFVPKVDVGSPKGPHRRHGDELLAWAKQQLQIALDIVDNPGGGLLFATQTMGQVRASLVAEDGDRFETVATLLHRAEDHAIHRDFDGAREALAEARSLL